MNPAFLRRLQDFMRARLPAALPFALMLGIVLGYVWFYLSTISPTLQSNDRAASQLSDTEQALATARSVPTTSPESLQTQVANANATQAAVSQVFLSPAQTGQSISALYQYAGASGVTISDLTITSSPTQTARATPTQTVSSIVQLTTVRVQGQGTSRQLVDFVSRIKEISEKTVLIDNLSITGTETAATLRMDLALYWSQAGSDITATPRATVTVAEATAIAGATATPTSTPTPTPTSAPTNVQPSAPPTPTRTIRGQAIRVKIYLIALNDNGRSGVKVGCGDSAVPVVRTLPLSQTPLSEAIRELLSIHERNYDGTGLYNALGQSNLALESAMLVGDKVTIRLTGAVSLSDTCDSSRFIEQVRLTALQFSTIRSVEVFVNGMLLSEALGGS